MARTTVAQVSQEVAELKAENAELKSMVEQVLAALAAQTAQVQAEPAQEQDAEVSKAKGKAKQSRKQAYAAQKDANIAAAIAKAKQSKDGGCFSIKGYKFAVYHERDWTWISCDGIDGYSDPMVAAIRDKNFLGGRYAKNRTAHSIDTHMTAKAVQGQLILAAKAHGIV